MSTLQVGVFIIESTTIDDEVAKDREGKLLKEMLQLIGVPVKYYYIRTKKELKLMLREFVKSNFKYLHISCHGNDEVLGLTLDHVYFHELPQMIGSDLVKRRIFLSACSVVNDNLKDALRELMPLSITGPNHDVNFYDAAIFWASFYRLVFKSNDTRISTDILKETIQRISPIFEVHITAYIKKKSSKGFNKYLFPNVDD